MVYLEPDGVLFSCDGFAAHLCPEEIIQSEPSEELDFQFQYYFDAIMRPFTGYIRRNLPKLDGFAVLKSLKTNSSTQNIPVLILSNLSQQKDIKKGHDFGAVDYLVKSYNIPSEVVKKVKSYLK